MRGPETPPSHRPAAAIGPSTPSAAPTPLSEPSVAAEKPDAAADAQVAAEADPCEASELDLDALFNTDRCRLPESFDAIRSDPALVLRVDASEIRVAPGGTASVPVLYENPTNRTLTLMIRGCSDAESLGALGVLGNAPTRKGLSRAFQVSVEDAAGKRADEAPGDGISCLSSCSAFGVAVRLPPGARARTNLEYRAQKHRWIQCEDEPAGPLPRGIYQLVLRGGTEQQAKTKLVVGPP